MKDDQRKSIEPKIESYLANQTFVVRKESAKETLHYLSRDLQPPLTGLVKSEVLSSGLMNRLASQESSTQRSILYLQNGNNDKVKKLETDIQVLCPNDECWLAGILDTYVDYVSRVSHTLIASLFTSFFLVLAVILWILGARRFQDSVPILISIFFGPAALCAVLALLQIPVNMNTTICISVIVGLSGDNALQFLLSKQKRLGGALRFKSLAAIMTALMMASISTIFLFSYLQPPRELGLLLIFSFLICLFGDVFVLQSLLKKSRDPIDSFKAE
jgi:predicted RND superfamily exporter protein